MTDNAELTEIELSQRILALLEEFGEENIFAMINSIMDPTGATKEVTVFANALQRLLNEEYVTMAYSTFGPRTVTDLEESDAVALLADLRKWFRFDDSDPHWTLASGDIRRERIPEICLTDDGRARSVEILTARGVEWWRQRRK